MQERERCRERDVGREMLGERCRERDVEIGRASCRERV